MLHFTSDSQRWIASQIPDAQVEIFAADEGGSHFMFVENPDRFDSIVLSFLAHDVRYALSFKPNPEKVGKYLFDRVLRL